MTPDSNNGGAAGNWSEYRRLVLAELRTANDNIEVLRKGQEELRVEVITLKVKSGLWGFTAGAIPAALALVWYLITGGTP